MKKIYLDHAATTPVDARVLAAMKPFFSSKYGNASSLHSFGTEAAKAIDDARQIIADSLRAEASEIIFTSGGTEANNLALKGAAYANRSKGKHIITTRIEHHCVIEACRWLERQGFEVSYLPVDKYGFVSRQKLERAIRDDTILASIMYANNEIGTTEPVSELAEICKSRGIYFHTDAVQAYGKIPLEMKNIDMLSLSAHKLYGPKGIGALFVRNVKPEPLLHGGGQERGFRSGTENVAGIVGFGAAASIAMREMKKDARQQSMLRDRLIKGCLKIENSFLNGHPKQRLPNNANVWFRFIEGESLVLMLDDKGIAASTGSACSSKSLEPSHVLLAIGLRHEEAHGSLRFSLGRQNTRQEIDYTIKAIPEAVERLREMSPFKKRYG